MGLDSSMLLDMAHSKHATEQQKNAAVSQQFESVLVKQFLKEALKPMFKGVFNEEGGAHRMYRHFFTDAISESIASGGGFGVLATRPPPASRAACATAAALRRPEG